MTGRHLLPSELDVRDPNFARQCLSWAHEAHRDMEELIARTIATIEDSSALFEHLDRLLSWRLGSVTDARAEWHFGGDGSDRDCPQSNDRRCSSVAVARFDESQLVNNHPGQMCEKCGEVAALVNFIARFFIARFGDRPAYCIFDCSACKHFTWVAQGEAGS